MNSRMTNFYMDIAKRCSAMSHARRLKVGAVIVKNNNIISFSWNGMPAGWDNNCEDVVWDDGTGHNMTTEEFDAQYPYEAWNEETQSNVRYGLKTKPEVMHAESNTVSKLARSNESGIDSDLFVTHAPCLVCAKLIYQTGIGRVWYGANYRDNSGIRFLKNSGVKVTQVDVSELD